MSTSRYKKGLFMVILSGIVFGIMPSAVTFCYSQGATASLVILFRYFILSLVLLPIVKKQGNLLENYRANRKNLMLLTMCGISTPILLFTAYTLLPTGITTTIHFMYPIVVALICAIFFHERLSLLKKVCIFLCAGGVFLIAEISQQKLNIDGILIALLSSVTWGCYIVFLNKLKLPGVTSEQVIFYVGVGSLLVITLYGMLTGGFSTTVTGVGWVALTLSNMVIAIFGSIFFAIGARRTDSHSSAIASTLEPITSVVVGVCFLKEPLSIRSVIGSIMILSAVLLLTIFGEKEKVGSQHNGEQLDR